MEMLNGFTPTATPAKSLEEVLLEKRGIKGDQIDQVIFRLPLRIACLMVVTFIGITVIHSLRSSRKQQLSLDLEQLKLRNRDTQAIRNPNTFPNWSTQVTPSPKTSKNSLPQKINDGKPSAHSTKRGTCGAMEVFGSSMVPDMYPVTLPQSDV